MGALGHRTAVLLAGTLRNSPLQEGLGVPVLCLPLGLEGSVLDAWLTALDGLGGFDDVRIVVNSVRDVDAIDALVRAGSRRDEDIKAIAEPASWRGAGGILRDVTCELEPDAVVYVVEANTIPPRDLGPIEERLAQPGVSGVVGVCGVDEPAGVYAFTQACFETVPPVGYHDLKEQMLPALAKRGLSVRTAGVGDVVHRLRDRDRYLEAVRKSLTVDGVLQPRVSPRASVSGSATIDGVCVVEDAAVIEDGAVVHDTIMLGGATVEGGAVVSRSVIGPLASVPARTTIVRKLYRSPEPARGAAPPAGHRETRQNV